MLDNNIDNRIIVLNFDDSKIPDFKEVRGKGFIYFGEDNNYPDYLTKLYNKSAKHNAIINGKLTYIFGEGFYCKMDDPNAEKWIFKVNSAGESLNDIAKKCALDIEIYGGFYLNILPNRLGQISEIYHLDFNRVRSNEDNSQFFYKNDWTNQRDKSKEFPAFNAVKMDCSSIFAYKEYRPGLRTYPLPNYIGCINYIESDMEVSKHTLTNAKTGFSASKMINFFNGEPAPEMQRDIHKRLEKKFTGSDGSKIVVTFNNDPAKAPTILDLGSSDLTKEDFAKVDALITSNLMAGHQITSPTLFGISEPGKLGTRNELKMAYDIFNNTYASSKQRTLEKVFNYLAKFKGIENELFIRSVDPVGIEFTDATLLAAAPKSWLLEKMGVDVLKYTDATVGGVSTQSEEHIDLESDKPSVNSVLTNLTGRQHQQINRIVRQYIQNKLTIQQASLMLKNGFGFSDADVNSYLGLGEAKFSEVHNELDVANMLIEHGQKEEDFTIVFSKEVNFTCDADMIAHEEEFYKKEVFAALDKLNTVETQILKMINKDPKVSAKICADALGITESYANTIIDDLETKGFIKSATANEYGELVVSRTLTKPLAELGTKIAVKLPQMQILYSYKVKPGVGAPIIAGTRPFCREMLSKPRLFSRTQIENLSMALGYSLWDRTGGFWNMGKGKGISASCRHMWKSNVVIKK
ncbi:Winged helix-turn-helix DNA-binding [uncultured Caudovirales phage]|uniref:Winged helix-turn-helix DNA-binding n=1 Tax=uncultured Caudovirales phage TaxID=2100421 RepID=A0A6J7WIW6_9CAUD|nr:Winged helix-turn-helix DNA-binding [uncultured Caudovirales phage]